MKLPAFIILHIFLLLVSGLFVSTNANQNTAYSLGERLDFKVYFEFVLGGEARMEIESIDTIDGEPCLRIASEARSTSTVDKFYKVRDRIVTWTDLEEGFTRKYSKRLQEGKWREWKLVEYQPEQERLFLTKKEGGVPQVMPLDSVVNDVLSAFYEVRNHDLKVGESVFIDLHDIDKFYKLEVRVLRREEVEVPAGKFQCLVIEPLLMSSGIFRKEGSLQVWLTDDAKKIPVLMQSKLYFGRVWAKLTKFKPGVDSGE